MQRIFISIVLEIFGVFGQFNDPVAVNDEIIRRLNKYDKVRFHRMIKSEIHKLNVRTLDSHISPWTRKRSYNSMVG